MALELTRSSFCYEELVRRLRDKEPFSLSRWGDGEWNAVLRQRPPDRQNCDGHHFFSDMSDALENSLRERVSNPQCYNYEIGMQPLGWRLFSEQIQAWLTANNAVAPWCNADLMVKPSMVTRLAALQEVLRELQVIVVGPWHLQGLKTRFPVASFIQVPLKDCWLEYPDILAQTKTAIAAQTGYCAVLVSTGMPAKVLVHDLYRTTIERAAVVDCGSIWDPYCGRRTRSYHSRMVMDREENPVPLPSKKKRRK